ncbi:hypothetical protein HMPREF6485_0297 [Segatella buccae ATCC 33574]|uniref:Uncharacterized protein n=1 Tax=Segatella buccae ATCC 33574 TaxID=873513 RepID=E6K3H1_9BACT|nr:hypothetical protein HMPREF6485_0297 [Segatella buccae ATCC 33574]
MFTLFILVFISMTGKSKIPLFRCRCFFIGNQNRGENSIAMPLYN